MNRKHNPEKINLEVRNIEIFENGLCIQWDSDIGFGEYTLYKDNETDKWKGDSECMDRGDDKEFLKSILQKTSEYIVENIKIIM